MQISTAAALSAYTDRQVATSPIEAAVAKMKAEQQQAAAKPFEPAPEIRPNVQDYVDIDRTLLLLHKG
ncbi:MAG: hypothetical protein M3N26_02210 [Pseudomonadota bacterium]|nr:hypothetical protein [Pseudomonadota bacterium]